MADIKCIITYPEQFIDRIGEFMINMAPATETVVSPGSLHVTRPNVDTSVYLHVVGMLFGAPGAELKMDVYIGTTKITPTPIEPTYLNNAGGYLFNWRLS